LSQLGQIAKSGLPFNNKIDFIMHEFSKVVRNELKHKIAKFLSSTKFLTKFLTGKVSNHILNKYIINEIVKKIGDAAFKNVSNARQFIHITKGLAVQKRLLKQGVLASRISSLTGATIGVGLETAEIAVNVIFRCYPYSGRAKRCCIEKALADELISYVYDIASIVVSTTIDISVIQPAAVTGATFVAGSTAGTGYAAAHFLLSAGMNGVLAGVSYGIKEGIYLQVTKPLRPEIRKLVKAIMDAMKLDDKKMSCWFMCAPNNTAKQMCGTGTSKDNSPPPALVSPQQFRKYKKVRVCLRDHRGGFLREYRFVDGEYAYLNAGTTCHRGSLLTLYTKSLPLKNGSIVFLQTERTHFLAGRANGKIEATKSWRNLDNMFYIFESDAKLLQGSRNVALMTVWGKWLSSPDTSGLAWMGLAGKAPETIVANREEMGKWEKFQLTYYDQVRPICLEAHHGPPKWVNTRYGRIVVNPGFYVSARAGSLTLQANKKSCSTWEIFQSSKVKVSKGKVSKVRGPLRSGDQIILMTYKGTYWKSAPSGTLVANASKASAWEVFTIEKVGARKGTIITSGSDVTIKNAHGKYITAGSPSTNPPMVANRSKTKKWEIFKMTYHR
jgi:hypothetical protein